MKIELTKEEEELVREALRHFALHSPRKPKSVAEHQRMTKLLRRFGFLFDVVDLKTKKVRLITEDWRIVHDPLSKRSP